MGIKVALSGYREIWLPMVDGGKFILKCKQMLKYRSEDGGLGVSKVLSSWPP
jgi:hypothetical protein